MYAHHAADEDAFASYLFQYYQENYKTDAYEESTTMLPVHRLLLRDYILVMLYDEQLNGSFIPTIMLKKQLYIEGKRIRRVYLTGFVHTSYERLQERPMQLRECLHKQLSYLM